LIKVLIFILNVEIIVEREKSGVLELLKRKFLQIQEARVEDEENFLSREFM